MIVCLWLSMGRMETNCNLKQCSLCTDAPFPSEKIGREGELFQVNETSSCVVEK